MRKLLGLLAGLLAGAGASLALQACGGPGSCQGIGSRPEARIAPGLYLDSARAAHRLEVSADLATATERGREGVADSVITYRIVERRNW